MTDVAMTECFVDEDGTFHCQCGATHKRGRCTERMDGTPVYLCRRCGNFYGANPRVVALRSAPHPDPDARDAARADREANVHTLRRQVETLREACDAAMRTLVDIRSQCGCELAAANIAGMKCANCEDVDGAAHLCRAALAATSPGAAREGATS
jgi:hypothetical protein